MRKVLDVCTGTGMMSLAIAQEIKRCWVIGIDFSEEMLKLSRINLVKYPEGKRIHLQYGNAMDLNFADDFFDCAVLAFSLRNVDDISHVLKEIKRVVSPDGIVITSDISKPEYPFFFQLYYYFYHLVPRVRKMISGQKGPYNYLPTLLLIFLTVFN